MAESKNNVNIDMSLNIDGEWDTSARRHINNRRPCRTSEN